MKQRIAYLDTIRLAAMTLMIICHACDPFNAGATYGAGEVDQDIFLWGSIWGSCVRACVPLFIMLTGALCLTTEQPMQVFWRRRIGRVLWPFLIWSAVYNMFPWFIKIIGQPESRVYDFFVWASDPSGDFWTCFKRVLEVPFRFDSLACHMWYVYALIGLYLYIPILAAWVRQATKRQVEMVLGLWVLSTCLPYMHEFVGRYLFGECEWNGFGLFYYFSGFTGYMLLGHYIVRYVPTAEPSATVAAEQSGTGAAEASRTGAAEASGTGAGTVIGTVVGSVVAFALGAWVTWRGFTHMTGLPDATPEQMELFWTYCSPNVVLMTAAVFLCVRLIKTGGRVARALKNFTACGFGIYMIHYFFVGPTYSWVEALCLPTALRVPAAAVLILALSWGVVALVKRIVPRTEWLLG